MFLNFEGANSTNRRDYMGKTEQPEAINTFLDDKIPLEHFKLQSGPEAAARNKGNWGHFENLAIS